MPESIDPAFMRRFGNKHPFEKPQNTEEVFDLIKSSLGEFEEKNAIKVADKIKGWFGNASQAFITRTAKKFIIRNNHGDVKGFNYEKLETFLNNASATEKI